MLDVFLLTLSNAGKLLLFIAVGYVLRRHHDLPKEAGKVLSSLLTRVISPAYSIYNISSSLTVDVLGQKLMLFGFGLLFALVAVGISFLLSKPFARNHIERSSLIYAFAFSNYGYFGYPIAEGVFGSAFLADMLVFALPLSLSVSTFGYSLFMSDHKAKVRDVLFSPLVVGVVIGAAIGLSGVKMPAFFTGALKSLGGCMSPCSMILAGFMMGKFPLKNLLTGWRPYVFSAIRLMGIPALYGLILLLLGVKGQFFMLAMLVASLPLGLNLVVYPESLGHEKEASENAKLCFISYLMALVVLPLAVALYTHIA